ncbi:MAG: hypothetical protein JST89_22575 [Cyanobacteria bacterium SZAS-4]|nr:hypothetical protein [Cyanobacteria bacterium SZAS-4]
MPPTEDFSTIAQPANDQSSAVLHELGVLSERPAPAQAQLAQYAPPQSESSAAPDKRVNCPDNAAHLPTVTVQEDGSRARAESKEHQTGTLTNQLTNLGLAAAALWGAEAIGAVVFRSPKLAAMALETGAGSAKVGLESTELGAEALKAANARAAAADLLAQSAKLGQTADLAAGSSKLGLAEQLATGSSNLKLADQLTTASSKFGFLTNDSAQLYGKIGMFTGTYGTSIAARHYGYEALTGKKESWIDSGNQVGTGVIELLLARQLWKWSAKL